MGQLSSGSSRDRYQPYYQKYPYTKSSTMVDDIEEYMDSTPEDTAQITTQDEEYY